MSLKNAVSRLCQTQSFASVGAAIVKTIAILSAILLIAASSGYGAVFAYSQGKAHGTFVAILAVLMGLGIEAAKPLVWHSVLTSFASWKIGRGFVLLLFGCVCIIFSVTSEISLISTNRSDSIAKRNTQAYSANASRDAYDAAKREFDLLAPNLRTVEELNVLLDIAKINPQKIKGCTAVNGSMQVLCPKISAELAKAKRKVELQGILDRSVDKIEHTQVTVSDPGSEAIRVYLAALGIAVSATVISQFLSLIPVIALEIGSACSAILISSVSGKIEIPKAIEAEAKTHTETAPKAEIGRSASISNMPQEAYHVRDVAAPPIGAFLAHSQQSYQPMPQRQNVPAMPQRQDQGASIYAFPMDRAHSRIEAEGKIVEALKMHNGSSAMLAYSERQLANFLGMDKSTVWRASRNLARKGVIRREASGNRCILTLLG